MEPLRERGNLSIIIKDTFISPKVYFYMELTFSTIKKRTADMQNHWLQSVLYSENSLYMFGINIFLDL